MFKPNQIIRAKRNHLLAKVKYIDSFKNMIQIEYIDPKTANYQGLFSYSISDLSQHWEVIEEPKIQEKVISLINGNSECNHVWKKYLGFNQVYSYCEKCDKKRF